MTTREALKAEAETYLANNAAESGADELIRRLVEHLTTSAPGEQQPVAFSLYDGQLDGRRSALAQSDEKK